MTKSNQSNAKKASCRKAFLRILSLTVTTLMIVGMMIMPVSAAEPATGAGPYGINSEYTFYRATDAIDATVTETDSEGNETSTATPLVSNDDSVWKFAVGTLGDTFKVSSDGFEAPTAEALQGGNSLKLTWTAPEGAEGKATVKVIADNYNKEVVVTGNSVTLKDVELGNVYQAQVTIGDVSSEILSYKHIYAPTYVTNSVFKEDNKISASSTRNFDYMFVNLEDYTDLIGNDSGILVKISSDITKDYNIISYTDNHNVYDDNGTLLYTDSAGNDLYKNTDESGNEYYTDSEGNVVYADSTAASAAKVAVKKVGLVSCDAEDAAMEKTSMADDAVSLAFHTTLKLPVRDDQGGMSVGDNVTLNSESEKMPVCFDVNGGRAVNTLKTDDNGSVFVTHTDVMKYQEFTEGYIFIPFEILDEASQNTIKENGAIDLNVSRQRYYAKNIYENNGSWSWNIVNWSETDFTDYTKDGEANYWFDRSVNFEEVAFISDYNEFLKCYTETVFNAGKTSEYKTGSFTYDKLSGSSNTSVVYTSVVDGITYTLKNDSVSSQYDYYNEKATYTVDAGAGFTYTTAAGEKMMLGFTVQQDGTYEISAPITTDAKAGVSYRLVRQDNDGKKTILQSEKSYSGEEHFTLMTAELKQGETIWFEAWANKAGTVIDIGVPQFRILGSKVLGSDGSITFNSLHYPQDIATSTDGASSLKEVNAAWQMGYFVNDFTVNGTEYDIAEKSVVEAEGATVVHDMLGLANLSATDNTETEDINETDASALYNALTPMEVSRYNSTETTCYYQPKYNRLKTLASVQNAGNGNYIGTTYIADRYYFRTLVGFGTAFAGGTYNMYYNAGTYFQFTATCDGTAAFSTAGTVTANAILLKNSTVIGTYVGGSGENLSTLNISVDVEKGDTITLCFADWSGEVVNYNQVTQKFGQSTKNNCYVSAPTVKLTPAADESSVTFDSETPSIMSEKYDNGATITLPTTAKNGAVFMGWSDGDTTYSAGYEYTVSKDIAFAAQYIYYGDLNGTGEGVDGVDLSILRQMLVKAENIEGAVNADITGDIDTDGEITLIDLIKMKKMSAGIDVTVGAK